MFIGSVETHVEIHISMYIIAVWSGPEHTGTCIYVDVIISTVSVHRSRSDTGLEQFGFFVVHLSPPPVGLGSLQSDDVLMLKTPSAASVTLNAQNTKTRSP